jgi:hypothetical protein
MLDKKMSRKAFLGSIGTVIVTLFFGRFLNFGKKDIDIDKLAGLDQSSYGKAPYGGVSKQ